MAPSAKASQPGYTGVTVYVAEDIWKQIRLDAMAQDTTASAIGASLMEHYVTGRITEVDSIRSRAQEITQGRRKRSD